MDWPDTLKTTAGALLVIGAALAFGSFWIVYAEPLWRIAALGTMVVLAIRIRERKESQRSDLLVVCVLGILVLLGSPAFGNP